MKQVPPITGAQCPPESQVCEQHWLLDAHADALVVPLGVHKPDGQIPPLHWNPEQHGMPSTHALPPSVHWMLPSGMHWPGLPAARLQLWEQQSSLPVHGSSLWWQSGGGGGS